MPIWVKNHVGFKRSGDACVGRARKELQLGLSPFAPFFIPRSALHVGESLGIITLPLVSLSMQGLSRIFSALPSHFSGPSSSLPRLGTWGGRPPDPLRRLACGARLLISLLIAWVCSRSLACIATARRQHHFGMRLFVLLLQSSNAIEYAADTVPFFNSLKASAIYNPILPFSCCILLQQDMDLRTYHVPRDLNVAAETLSRALLHIAVQRAPHLPVLPSNSLSLGSLLPPSRRAWRYVPGCSGPPLCPGTRGLPFGHLQPARAPFP